MEICKTNSISNYILKQQVKYAAHLVRAPNYVKNKQLLFNANINIKRGRKSQNLIENAAKELHIDTDQLHRVAIARKEEFYLNMINEWQRTSPSDKLINTIAKHCIAIRTCKNYHPWYVVLRSYIMIDPFTFDVNWKEVSNKWWWWWELPPAIIFWYI